MFLLVVSQLKISRSGHLDIKDAQCAETKNVLQKSYHIISCFPDMGAQKRHFRCPKIKFSSKVAKFARKIEIDLTIIFRINDFYFMRILVFAMHSFVIHS